MEQPINSGAGTQMPGTPMSSMGEPVAPKTKGPIIAAVVIIVLVIMGAMVYALMPKPPREVIIETATPTASRAVTSTPLVSVSPEATTTPTTVTQSKVYSNQYMSVRIPSGWSYSTTQSGAINIMKNNYILYINPAAGHASGVEGGRFGEIAAGAPSSDAVMEGDYPGPCSTPQKSAVAQEYTRSDYYIDSKNNWSCGKYPVDGSTIWYFSHMTKGQGYFNYYTQSSLPPPAGYVITMAYNSKDINMLPKKGSEALNTMLKEMTAIAATLELKQK